MRVRLRMVNRSSNAPELTGVGEIYNIHFTKILPSQTRETARLKTQLKESSDAKNNKV